MHQEILVRQLRLLFPHEKTFVNTKQVAFSKESSEKENDPIFELDVWIPAYNLSFEFQDAYHYVHTWYSQKSLGSIQSKDNIKKFIVKQKGITLIEIPCWWDGGLESLAATIHFQRPDVIGSGSSPIPINPAFGMFKESEVPAIGELMRASFPVQNMISIPPNTWWMGEKYDGIRLCWNPFTREVYSRSGREIPLPPEFTTKLPSLAIEGEFWFGRDSFSEAASLIQSYGDVISWHLLRLIAFDSPLKILHPFSFEDRYKLLLALIDNGHEFSILAFRVMAKNNIHLEWAIKEIVGDEGEGVILRRVGSRYEPGRTSSLYKLKTPYGDTEGVVVGYGDQNSVQLRLPSGTIFTVPARHVLTPALPAIGAVVTFSYEMHVRTEAPASPKIVKIRTDDFGPSHEQIRADHASPEIAQVRTHDFSTGFPASPKITRIRTDVSWNDVVANFADESRFVREKLQKTARISAPYFKSLRDATAENNEAWTSVENRRAFFENFAKENRFDPRNPNNWYHVTKVQFLATCGAKKVLQYHKRSLRKALVDLFPDIGLDRSKLKPSWQDPKKRRRFFEEFAHSHGFDPRKAENWYWQTHNSVVSVKGGHRVLKYHEGSVNKAIADLFPDIGFDKSKIVASWEELKNRRRFFEDYARENNFDPLQAKNWYFQPWDRIMSFKGAVGVMSYHKTKVHVALLECFPDIGLSFDNFLWYKSR